MFTPPGTTSLPGFQNPVQDAQQTFRQLLASLALPGQLYTLPPFLTPPPGLTLACAAACLTLIDLDTRVWLQPGFATAVHLWIVFHTGCRLVSDPQQATFALIHDCLTMPALTAFQSGTTELPETSTTLLLQIEDWQSGQPVSLNGPGIQTPRTIAPKLPKQFWSAWQLNAAQYPLGVDVFLFSQQSLMGLPRSTQVEASQ